MIIAKGLESPRTPGREMPQSPRDNNKWKRKSLGEWLIEKVDILMPDRF